MASTNPKSKKIAKESNTSNDSNFLIVSEQELKLGELKEQDVYQQQTFKCMKLDVDHEGDQEALALKLETIARNHRKVIDNNKVENESSHDNLNVDNNVDETKISTAHISGDDISFPQNSSMAYNWNFSDSKGKVIKEPRRRSNRARESSKNSLYVDPFSSEHIDNILVFDQKVSENLPRETGCFNVNEDHTPPSRRKRTYKKRLDQSTIKVEDLPSPFLRESQIVVEGSKTPPPRRRSYKKVQKYQFIEIPSSPPSPFLRSSEINNSGSMTPLGLPRGSRRRYQKIGENKPTSTCINPSPEGSIGERMGASDSKVEVLEDELIFFDSDSEIGSIGKASKRRLKSRSRILARPRSSTDMKNVSSASDTDEDIDPSKPLDPASLIKPDKTFSEFIVEAINSSESNQIKLKGIYRYIKANSPYYRYKSNTRSNGWKVWLLNFRTQ